MFDLVLNKKLSLEYEAMLKEIELCISDDIFMHKKFAYKEREINGLPVPSADEYMYHYFLYNGFIQNPIRLKNYILAKNQLSSHIINHLPIILDIEPISRCNFSCIMCQVKDWDNNKRAEDMDFESFTKLIDSQYGLTEVKLQGIGEPLMHKDFFKMLDYLTDRHIWVRTTINGSLLHKNNNYKKLVDSKIGEVQVSFDGATKEVFEKIRVNSNFDKIVENVTFFNEYANQKDRLISRMWVLIQNHNSHQIEEFINIAKKMKFKRVTFSIGISDWGGQEEFKNSNLKVKKLDRASIIEKIMELRNIHLELNITFWDLQEKYNENNICKWPFYRAFIGSDMKISPCCMIANPDVAYLGDAINFTETWNNEIYQDFRKKHMEYNIPDFCKNCYVSDDL